MLNIVIKVCLIVLLSTTAWAKPLPAKCEFELLKQQIVKSIVNDINDIHTGLNKSKGRSKHFQLIPVFDSNKLNILLQKIKQQDDFYYEEFVLTSGKLVNLVYDGSTTWDKFGYGLINKDGNWFIFYQAGVSSKGFTPMFSLSSIGENKIEAVICVHDCSWWGKNVWATLDFSTLTYDVIEEAETTFLNWSTEQ